MRQGMWAVGENCVAAMKFEILGFLQLRGQAFAHLLGGGGGAFQPQGASLGQI